MGVRGETGQCNHMRDRADMTSKQESKVHVKLRGFFFDDPFFKNSWEDFDKVRNAMFQESRDMWKKFDADFRETACMNSNIMLEAPSSGNHEITQSESRGLHRQDSKSRWEDGWMFPRRWMLPSIAAPLKDMDLFQTPDSEVIRVKEDDSKMEVSLDTAQYRPDELKVTVANGAVTVEGKHEERAEDGSRMVSRSFSRKYTLPHGSTGGDVVSNLSSDGVLVITASKNNPAITHK